MKKINAFIEGDIITLVIDKTDLTNIPRYQHQGENTSSIKQMKHLLKILNY